MRKLPAAKNQLKPKGAGSQAIVIKRERHKRLNKRIIIEYWKFVC
jgi:hypothetical protein